jgi:universal stress protein E
MDRITEILVIVDPTASDQPALAKAATLAKHLQSSVELLACDTKSSREFRLAKHCLDSTIEPRNLNTWLESLATPLRAQDIAVRTSCITGDPLHDQLLRWMRSSPADLVIKDTHHHSLAKRTFIGNTDWHLIQHCQLPLLLAKPTQWRTPPIFAAAIDPPHETNQQALLDRRILECTQLLAHALNGEFHAVHAYFPAMVTAAVADCRVPGLLGVTPDLLTAESELHRSRTKSFLTPYGIPDRCQHVEMGVPSQCLPQIAGDWHIDVLIMGALSRNHLKQAIIGSTAERVLEYLPCDILVMKASKFGEHLPF